MEFTVPDRCAALQDQLKVFLRDHVYPAERTYRSELRTMPRRQPPIMETLKAEARRQGLWNLFLPDSVLGGGLSVLDYAPLAELTGRSPIAPEALNCSAPDTGNMEILHLFGTAEQKARWLHPLLAGEIRSAFLMTEPQVASSDATNIETRIERDGDDYVITGRKWWATNMARPDLGVLIVMGRSDPQAERHRQHSMILVPPDAPGVTIERFLSVFGYVEMPAGHAEVRLDGVRVPADYMLAGEGRGFEIAQGRLGPGRVHHCMRVIGSAERALELMCTRLLSRHAFGKRIADHSVWEQRVAEARTELDMCRLLVLQTAWLMDRAGNRAARMNIAQIKVAAPRVALKVIDWAIQAFGAAGLAEDFGLAEAYAAVRTIRIADGPDEVHNRSIARLEFTKHADGAGVDALASSHAS